jgi:hypothetical protein
MAEMALRKNRSDPGNVKGTDGKGSFLLDKGEGRAPLKSNIQGDMRSGLLTWIIKNSILFPR